MIKKLKTALLTLVFSLTSFGAPLATVGVASVSAQNINKNLCAGAELDVNGDCDEAVSDETGQNVSDLIVTAINLFSLVIGVISVIMIMVGGVKYITSQGSSDSVTGAKNTILYAVIGLIVVALAQLIVRFVLGTANEIAG